MKTPHPLPRTLAGYGLSWAVIGIVVASCSSTNIPSPPSENVMPTPASWRIEIVGSDGETSLVSVTDESGLVAGVAEEVPVELARMVSDIAIGHAGNDESTLAVAWVALPCERRPSLVVAERNGVVAITLDRGLRVPPECESLGVVNGLTLRLSEAVPLDKVAATSE